jgi:hypothetical protein
MGDIAMTIPTAAPHAIAIDNVPTRPRRCRLSSTAPTRVARSARFAIARSGDL